MNRLGRRVVVAMLLGVALYGAFVLYRGASSIAASFATYAAWTFAAACGLAFSNYVLRFLKWEYYLAALDIRGVPKGESFLVFLSGFVLTVTPGKVGEVFKSLVLHEIRGVPVTRTAPIVVAERLTDLIGVIVMIAVGSLGFHGGLPFAAAGAAIVLGLLAFVTSRRLSRAVLELLPRLPGALGRVGHKVAPRVEAALVELRVLTSPRRLVLPSLLSIAAWSLEGIALWVILQGFHQAAPLAITAFFYATATLAGALVPVPGGLGVTDGLLEEQMAKVGHVAPATATAAMLLARFATLWFAVLVGFVALFLLRLKHPELTRGGETDRALAGGPQIAIDEKTP
ncbi:MAG TPA: lysylphosphatidylglycerol synthase transmembrane domain-containing protein [Byssovorax sp.]